MAHVQLMLRLLLLLISCYGYIRCIGKYLRWEFTVGVFFASVCSTMFLAGILNILKEAAWGICLVGVFLAFRSLLRREPVQDVLCPGIAAFILACAVLLPIIHGLVFTDYDDFSHWGTVVKVLYTQNRFPNFSDSIITYQSYPTGSAAFIYYMLTVVGIHSEWFQLYVQAVFMVGVLASLFAFVRNWMGWIFAAVMGAVFLLCSNGLINLLVDTLLPIVAVGGLCICHYYRDSFRRMVLWAVPYLVSLVAIKNSGILLAIFLLLYALLYFQEDGICSWLIASVSPLAALFLWQKHVQLVFDNGLNSRHAMSVTSITDKFAQKGLEEVAEVTDIYMNRMLSLSNPALYMLAAALILLILLCVLKRETRKDLRKLVVFSVVCYVIYGIGMLGMYLSTMPYGEAVNLAGFSRYHRTILIFCGAFLYLAAAEAGKEVGETSVAVWALTALLSYGALFPGLWYNNPKHCGFIRIGFEQLITEYRVKPEMRYCVVLDESTQQYNGYLKYTIRYLLDSANMFVGNIDDYEARENGWAGYDYLICFGETAEMDSFLVEQFGSAENRVIPRS